MLRLNLVIIVHLLGNGINSPMNGKSIGNDRQNSAPSYPNSPSPTFGNGRHDSAPNNLNFPSVSFEKHEQDLATNYRNSPRSVIRNDRQDSVPNHQQDLAPNYKNSAMQLIGNHWQDSPPSYSISTRPLIEDHRQDKSNSQSLSIGNYIHDTDPNYSNSLRLVAGNDRHDLAPNYPTSPSPFFGNHPQDSAPRYPDSQSEQDSAQSDLISTSKSLYLDDNGPSERSLEQSIHVKWVTISQKDIKIGDYGEVKRKDTTTDGLTAKKPDQSNASKESWRLLASLRRAKREAYVPNKKNRISLLSLINYDLQRKDRSATSFEVFSFHSTLNLPWTVSMSGSDETADHVYTTNTVIRVLFKDVRDYSTTELITTGDLIYDSLKTALLEEVKETNYDDNPITNEIQPIGEEVTLKLQQEEQQPISVLYVDLKTGFKPIMSNDSHPKSADDEYKNITIKNNQRAWFDPQLIGEIHTELHGLKVEQLDGKSLLQSKLVEKNYTDIHDEDDLGALLKTWEVKTTAHMDVFLLTNTVVQEDSEIVEVTTTELNLEWPWTKPITLASIDHRKYDDQKQSWVIAVKSEAILTRKENPANGHLNLGLNSPKIKKIIENIDGNMRDDRKQDYDIMYDSAEFQDHFLQIGALNSSSGEETWTDSEEIQNVNDNENITLEFAKSRWPSFSLADWKKLPERLHSLNLGTNILQIQNEEEGVEVAPVISTESIYQLSTDVIIQQLDIPVKLNQGQLQATSPLDPPFLNVGNVYKEIFTVHSPLNRLVEEISSTQFNPLQQYIELDPQLSINVPLIGTSNIGTTYDVVWPDHTKTSATTTEESLPQNLTLPKSSTKKVPTSKGLRRTYQTKKDYTHITHYSAIYKIGNHNAVCYMFNPDCIDVGDISQACDFLVRVPYQEKFVKIFTAGAAKVYNYSHGFIERTVMFYNSMDSPNFVQVKYSIFDEDHLYSTIILRDDKFMSNLLENIDLEDTWSTIETELILKTTRTYTFSGYKGSTSIVLQFIKVGTTVHVFQHIRTTPIPVENIYTIQKPVSNPVYIMKMISRYGRYSAGEDSDIFYIDNQRDNKGRIIIKRFLIPIKNVVDPGVGLMTTKYKDNILGIFFSIGSTIGQCFYENKMNYEANWWKTGKFLCFQSVFIDWPVINKTIADIQNYTYKGHTVIFRKFTMKTFGNTSYPKINIGASYKVLTVKVPPKDYIFTTRYVCYNCKDFDKELLDEVETKIDSHSTWSTILDGEIVDFVLEPTLNYDDSVYTYHAIKNKNIPTAYRIYTYRYENVNSFGEKFLLSLNNVIKRKGSTHMIHKHSKGVKIYSFFFDLDYFQISQKVTEEYILKNKARILAKVYSFDDVKEPYGLDSVESSIIKVTTTQTEEYITTTTTTRVIKYGYTNFGKYDNAFINEIMHKIKELAEWSTIGKWVKGREVMQDTSQGYTGKTIVFVHFDISVCTSARGNTLIRGRQEVRTVTSKRKKVKTWMRKRALVDKPVNADEGRKAMEMRKVSILMFLLMVFGGFL